MNVPPDTPRTYVLEFPMSSSTPDIKANIHLLFSQRFRSRKNSVKDLPDKHPKLRRNIRLPQPDPTRLIHPTSQSPPVTILTIQIHRDVIRRFNRENPIRGRKPYQFILYILARQRDGLNGSTGSWIKPLTEFLIISSSLPLLDHLLHLQTLTIRNHTRVVDWKKGMLLGESSWTLAEGPSDHYQFANTTLIPTIDGQRGYFATPKRDENGPEQ
ncbi:unnamed protein product [Linum trigynum]|uniref:Uncharacterized protein n=1 Tax=Linum trigynum TaxID=586398 RepID=A0AAV2GK97_9ROSI